MKGFIIIICMAILLVMVAFSTQILALSIVYETYEIGDGTWEYAYTVHNYSFSQDYGLTIYFDYGLYDDIIPSDNGDDWDILTWDPGIYLGYEESGAYDALALADGASLADPFIVQFNWLGAGIPGNQLYSIYESTTWTMLESGITLIAPTDEAVTMLIGCPEGYIESIDMVNQDLEEIPELSLGLNFVRFQIYPSLTVCRSFDLVKFLAKGGDPVSIQSEPSPLLNYPSKASGNYLFFDKICGKDLQISPGQVYRIYRQR